MAEWSKSRGEKLRVAGSSPGGRLFAFRSLKSDRVGRTGSDSGPVQLRPPGSEPGQPPTMSRPNKARPFAEQRCRGHPRRRPASVQSAATQTARRTSPDERPANKRASGPRAGPAVLEYPAGRRRAGEQSSGRQAGATPTRGLAGDAELPARTTPSGPGSQRGVSPTPSPAAPSKQGPSSVPAEQRVSDVPARQAVPVDALRRRVLVIAATSRVGRRVATRQRPFQQRAHAPPSRPSAHASADVAGSLPRHAIRGSLEPSETR